MFIGPGGVQGNEYGHLFNYGAGTVFGSGVTPSSPGPFTNVQSGFSWSGTEFAPVPASTWVFYFGSCLMGLLGLVGRKR